MISGNAALPEQLVGLSNANPFSLQYWSPAGVHLSQAASPSPPGRSSRHTAKPRAEGGEGLANIALDCVSTDQSDFTETIRSNLFMTLMVVN